VSFIGCRLSIFAWARCEPKCLDNYTEPVAKLQKMFGESCPELNIRKLDTYDMKEVTIPDGLVLNGDFT